MGSAWVTVPSLKISKHELSKLPEEVLSLIAMGQYSLYRAEVKDYLNYRYVLRTGEREFFFLAADGEPIAPTGSEKFDIQEKVLVEDVSVKSVVPNFNRV